MQLFFKYLLAVVLLALTFSLQAFATGDSSDVAVSKTIVDQESYYSTALLDALTRSEIVDGDDDEFGPTPKLTDKLAKKRDSVVAMMDAFVSKNKFAEDLPDKIDKLPIGIKKTMGNAKWVLMLTNLTVTPEGGIISAYLRVELPEKNKSKILYFGVEGIRLNSDGGIADMKLVMLGAYDITMGRYKLVLTGSMDLNTGLSTPQSTYAIVGCQGLKLVNLVGYLELSNKVVIPVNPAESNVKAAFAISAKSFDDIVVQLSLPAFEVKGLNDVEFTVTNAVFDMSDTRNAPSMAFPAGYQNKYYAGNSLVWQGVYVGQLSIVLPKQFENKKTGIRPSFTGQNMIIDQQGVSGLYSVNATILALEEGNASGWKFSVNQVTIELEANKLTKGGFAGDLVLPIANKKRPTVPLAYRAIITDNDDYLLTVVLKDTIEFDLLQADVLLKPNSYVKLDLVKGDNGDKSFKPMAVLTGTMQISSLFKGTLGFTELKLMTDAPYIHITGVSYTKQNEMSNYPVSISGLGLAETTIDGQNCLEFKFTIAVNIDEDKIKGNTTISLSAYYDKPPGDNTEGKWKFYKFRIYEVNLQAEFSALKVAGTIIFLQDDPVYGNGFYGQVTMTYNGKFSIMSEAIFGAKDFRYWYVYAQIELPTAITVVGPFMLNGFGGGAYSKMSLAPRGSRIPYVPDASSAFGVKAMVMYVVAKKEVCKGNLMFEMCFNSTGGVKYISFYGTAEILAGSKALASLTETMDKADPSALAATSKTDSDKIASGNVQEVANESTSSSTVPTSSIFACIGIMYNFETSTLEANCEVFITLGILKGRGANNRAGWMQFHMSPGRWYCYAGTPEDRLGIVIAVAGMQLQTGSYFMVGTEMPTFPPPPPQVVRILGPELYQTQSNISEGSLKTGSGFAFGLDLSLRADINFMILYANMSAGVGVDIMLRQYPDAHCQGSTDELGINSWYANGRVYTYLEGEIGVKVDLMFIHANIPILQGAAAAMLEGGGPHPTYARGYLRVRFSILGGKISGDMNMKMSLGEECIIVNNTQAPVNFKIISDITPATNATEVDVFSSPQIAFNVAVDEGFEVSQDQGSTLFRVKIRSLQLLDGSKELTFTQDWTNKKQTLTLTPENTLPSKSTVQLKVKVEFEIWQNNSWTAYVVNGKTPAEEQVVSFTTSLAPDNIPHRNIAYMYPAHQQKNVYREEQKTGYIILKQWQDYLLEADTKTNKYVRLTSGDGRQTMLTPTFSRSDKKISFDISGLQSAVQYQAELVTRPIGAPTRKVDSTSTQYADQESGSYTLTENKAETVVKNDSEKLLLGYNFGTSKYTTLALKLDDINASIGPYLVFLVNSDYVNVRTKRYEAFDSTELFGSVYTADKPLITFQSLLTDAYYKNTIYPTLYKDFPYGSSGIRIKDRDINEYGFPPARAMYHDPEYELDPARMPYINGLVDVYRKDYHEVESQFINQYINGNTTLLKSYPQFFKNFPEPTHNTIEQVEFVYNLPGNQQGTRAVINYKR